MAQCNDGPNEICIVFDYPDPCCQNCLYPAPFGQTIQGYIVLHNPTAVGGASGFEFQVCNPGGAPFLPPSGCFVTAWGLPTGAINVYDPPVFAVGIPTPLPQEPCVLLVTMDILVYCQDCWCFGVMPLDMPSVPGQMVYADGADPGNLIQMYPCTGPTWDPCYMACIGCETCPPDEPIGTDTATWGNLKTLYR
jgi:hypothetical protein